MPNPKEKKPVQEIPEEENIITPQEFEDLEKKEKKGLKIFSGKKLEKPKSGIIGPDKKKGFLERLAGGGSSEDQILMSIEKITAKLETIEGLRQVSEEKISRISEEIGELRSAILEKERTFNQVETGFGKIKEMFDEIQPKKIRAELDKKEDAIEKLGAKMESLDTKIADMKKNMADVIAIMEKIKDLKNVVAVSGNITKKMAKIDDDKKEMTKTAARVESMFSELSEKVAEFHKYKEKIELSADSMHDLMKSIDMLEVKVENSVNKDDFRKIDDRFEQMERDLNDKIQTIRDIVDELVTSLKKGGVKELLEKEGKSRINDINKRLSEITTYEKSLQSLKGDIGKIREEKNKEISTVISEINKLKSPPAKIAAKSSKTVTIPIQVQSGYTPDESPPIPPDLNDIFSLMEQCNKQIDRGEIDSARSTYTQILSIYEQLKDGQDYEKSSDIYSKIKRLYYRLQIYA